jgi:hypothetical protein
VTDQNKVVNWDKYFAGLPSRLEPYSGDGKTKGDTPPRLVWAIGSTLDYAPCVAESILDDALRVWLEKGKPEMWMFCTCSPWHIDRER